MVQMEGTHVLCPDYGRVCRGGGGGGGINCN